LTFRCLVVIASVTLAACAPPPRPSSNPAPQRDASASVEPSSSATMIEAARVGEASAQAVARRADSIAVSVSDVARQAVQVFGDSIPSDSASTVADDVEGENSPTWDMDVESYVSQQRVEHFVRMFSGPARDRIAERLQQGTRYEPMIRQKLREGGLPEDMYYLALVESGFNPHAYSRAAAVGMWQFMTSTGRGMGLRIDWWVDERRDPMRSTAAAVRFIRGLRDQFGSLYLAAAAYNGGPGRVARGLKRFEDELEGQEGEDLFFALAEQDYLRKETKDYVPQLIAAALVAKDPAKYGMTFSPLPPFAYDSALVGPESAVPAIARAAGASVAEIKELNPHLLRGITPPRGDWMVRIPVGSRERFESSWKKLDRDEQTGMRRVVVKKGMSAESIASKHGVTVRQIAAYNPSGIKRTKKGRTAVGQTLLVPTSAVASAAFLVPDPDIERYGSSTTRSSKGKKTSVELHVVKRGENLSTIARKYGTTTKRLQQLNRLRKPLIFPGQSLVVKGAASSTRTAVSRSSSRTPRVVQAGSVKKKPAVSATTKKSTSKKSTASAKSRSAKAAASKKGSVAAKATGSATKKKSAASAGGAQ
jgi:membrane-bound lytic murein transglycosylase D